MMCHEWSLDDDSLLGADRMKEGKAKEASLMLDPEPRASLSLKSCDISDNTRCVTAQLNNN